MVIFYKLLGFGFLNNDGKIVAFYSSQVKSMQDLDSIIASSAQARLELQIHSKKGHENQQNDDKLS